MVLNNHRKLYIIEPTVLAHPASVAKGSGQVYALVHWGLAASNRLILHFQEAGKKL